MRHHDKSSLYSVWLSTTSQETFWSSCVRILPQMRILVNSQKMRNPFAVYFFTIWNEHKWKKNIRSLGVFFFQSVLRKKQDFSIQKYLFQKYLHFFYIFHNTNVCFSITKFHINKRHGIPHNEFLIVLFLSSENFENLEKSPFCTNPFNSCGQMKQVLACMWNTL